MLKPGLLPALEHVIDPAPVRIDDINTLSTPIDLFPTFPNKFIELHGADMSRDFDCGMVVPSAVGLPFGNWYRPGRCPKGTLTLKVSKADGSVLGADQEGSTADSPLILFGADPNT